MNQPAAPQSVQSPCVKVCRLDDEGVCVGCFRTIDEIASWQGMTPAEQGECVARAIARASQHT